jgi:hypothetical protein
MALPDHLLAYFCKKHQRVEELWPPKRFVAHSAASSSSSVATARLPRASSGLR